jgi:hypothetical protein
MKKNSTFAASPVGQIQQSNLAQDTTKLGYTNNLCLVPTFTLTSKPVDPSRLPKPNRHPSKRQCEDEPVHSNEYHDTS